MSRKDGRTPRAERIRALLASGDHAGARGEARAALSDADAPPEERAAAAAALASLSPEPAAVVAGALGIAASVVVSVLVLLRS